MRDVFYRKRQDDGTYAQLDESILEQAGKPTVAVKRLLTLIDYKTWLDRVKQKDVLGLRERTVQFGINGLCVRACVCCVVSV